jgi:hypothetical protein
MAVFLRDRLRQSATVLGRLDLVMHASAVKILVLALFAPQTGPNPPATVDWPLLPDFSPEPLKGHLVTGLGKVRSLSGSSGLLGNKLRLLFLS